MLGLVRSHIFQSRATEFLRSSIILSHVCSFFSNNAKWFRCTAANKAEYNTHIGSGSTKPVMEAALVPARPVLIGVASKAQDDLL